MNVITFFWFVQTKGEHHTHSIYTILHWETERKQCDSAAPYFQTNQYHPIFRIWIGVTMILYSDQE